MSISSVFERDGSEFAIVRKSREDIFKTCGDRDDGDGGTEDGGKVIRWGDGGSEMGKDGGREGMRGGRWEKELRWNKDMVNVGT